MVLVCQSWENHVPNTYFLILYVCACVIVCVCKYFNVDSFVDHVIAIQ